MPCRVLEPGMDVSSIYSLMLDAANGKIEFDVQASKGPQGAITRLTGALDARCPQTQPLRLLRCLGHQHIGASCQLVLGPHGRSGAG